VHLSHQREPWFSIPDQVLRSKRKIIHKFILIDSGGFWNESGGSLGNPGGGSFS